MTSDPARLTAAPNADVLTAHLMRRGLVDDPSGLASSATQLSTRASVRWRVRGHSGRSCGAGWGP